MREKAKEYAQDIRKKREAWVEQRRGHDQMCGSHVHRRKRSMSKKATSTHQSQPAPAPRQHLRRYETKRFATARVAARPVVSSCGVDAPCVAAAFGAWKHAGSVAREPLTTGSPCCTSCSSPCSPLSPARRAAHSPSSEMRKLSPSQHHAVTLARMLGMAAETPPPHSSAGLEERGAALSGGSVMRCVARQLFEAEGPAPASEAEPAPSPGEALDVSGNSRIDLKGGSGKQTECNIPTCAESTWCAPATTSPTKSSSSSSAQLASPSCHDFSSAECANLQLGGNTSQPLRQVRRPPRACATRAGSDRERYSKDKIV